MRRRPAACLYSYGPIWSWPILFAMVCMANGLYGHGLHGYGLNGQWPIWSVACVVMAYMVMACAVMVHMVNGLYGHGLYSYCPHSCGLYSYGLYRNGLYSHRLRRHGLYSHGLYRRKFKILVGARVFLVGRVGPFVVDPPPFRRGTKNSEMGTSKQWWWMSDMGGAYLRT